MRLKAAFAVVAGVAVAAALADFERTPPFGFTPASAGTHLGFERRFLAATDRNRIREAHRLLTSAPHPAGSERNRELADWIARGFRDAGLEDVAITAHEVMLPQALEVTIELTSPPWRASMYEPALPEDGSTSISREAAGIPFHAFSASDDVIAPVVYAGEGTPSDYDWLAASGIDVRGKIVLVRQSRRYRYRGYKAFVAEQRGAAGILMFSDPAMNGSAEGEPYPRGRFGPDTRIERGGILYDFLVPGDPTTPGQPSTADARRIAPAEARSMPRIVSAPLSAVDARTILATLDGPATPRAWHGGLAVQYRAGPGRANVHMRVRIDNAVRPIWTVTGIIRGTTSPDDLVIVGNHRDAWVFGGVDPSSGTAALVELARTLGELRRQGWTPKRSLLFASWDAEELALTSSTEWGEQHQQMLRERAIAYLNVDSAASGRRFAAAAVPSLGRVIGDAAQAVRDPIAGIPVAAVARSERSQERSDSSDSSEHAFVESRLGGGSDYAVFLNHLGIPSADLSFDGPHGVYHSLYDTHDWVARFGDPGFLYHAALVQIWGITALRLSSADSLPLDPMRAADRMTAFVDEIAQRARLARVRVDLQPIVTAIADLGAAASAFERERTIALRRQDGAGLSQLDRRLLRFERAFIDDDGLEGRAWYRHLVHAPRFTYEAEVLPGLAAAIDAADEKRSSTEALRIREAILRAAAWLTGR